MKIPFQKNKKGVAAITLVLLLGFLSLLTMTSITSYNAWRWENLNITFSKDAQNDATQSVSLYDYILLMRQRESTTLSNITIYNSFDDIAGGLGVSQTIGASDVITNCNPVSSMPATFNTKTAKRITVVSTKGNLVSNKSCCTPAIYNGTSEDEWNGEQILYTYSKENCKNLKWPNLVYSEGSIINSSLTP